MMEKLHPPRKPYKPLGRPHYRARSGSDRAAFGKAMAVIDEHRRNPAFVAGYIAGYDEETTTNGDGEQWDSPEWRLGLAYGIFACAAGIDYL